MFYGHPNPTSLSDDEIIISFALSLRQISKNPDETAIQQLCAFTSATVSQYQS